MTYRADPSIKLNTGAVEEIKRIAKAEEERDFDDIQEEVAKKFNLTKAEVAKAMRRAQYELALELA